MATLKTETNTRSMMSQVLKAARERFPHKRISAVFEHGQWWISLKDGSQYSVVDAEGPGSINGFDFEMVTEPYDN